MLQVIAIFLLVGAIVASLLLRKPSTKVRRFTNELEYTGDALEFDKEAKKITIKKPGTYRVTYTGES